MNRRSSNRMNAVLSLACILVTACVGATVSPKQVDSDQQSAMGEPTALQASCTALHGVYCATSDLCCPQKTFNYCPPAGAVYPANQVCSAHPQ